jgi:hypothetical protein
VRVGLYFLFLTFIIYSSWAFAIKPLASFQEALNAKQAFDRMDLISAENHLKNAIAWDPIPAKTYSDLAFVLWMRYQTQPSNKEFLDQAIEFQKQSLKREPLNKFYLAQLEELTKL